MTSDSELRIRLIARRIPNNYHYDLLANWLQVPSYYLPERRTFYPPLRDFIVSPRDVKWLADQVIVKLTLSEQERLCQLLTSESRI